VRALDRLHLAHWRRRPVGSRGRYGHRHALHRQIDGPNFEARRHDIINDPLEANAFDIVHCRLLLEHLPAADIALSKMIAALKPGGALLVEEFDHVSFLPVPDASGDTQEAWYDFMAAFAAIADTRGLDLTYGRSLRPLLEARGMQDVTAQGATTCERGGAEGRGLLLLSVASMRDLLIATGHMDSTSVDRLIAALQDETFYWSSQVMVAATGRKPA